MSKLEEQFALQLKAEGIEGWEREYKFHPERRFRLDFAFLTQKVGVEIQGGTWIAGRHSGGVGFERDCEKFNLATLFGWKILKFTGKHIKNGQAIEWIKEALF